MKHTISYSLIILSGLLITGCGQEKEEKKAFKYESTQSGQKKETTTTKAQSTTDASVIDLSNKGIGPVKSLTLASETDQELATEGAEVFKNMCTACHKIGKKFIGPSLTGILDRRAPEWVMNMILNPEEMTKNDPIAKQLLIESNGAPMANQNLTEAQARAILEYLRTLK